MIRQDHDRFLFERPCVPVTFKGAIGFCVQHHRGQIKLLDQFRRPLLADRSRTDDQEFPFPLRPFLAENDTGFDRLAEPNLVREDHTFCQRRLQREHGRLNLVRVQVHRSIEQRHRELISRAGRGLLGQVMGKIFGVICGGHELL